MEDKRTKGVWQVWLNSRDGKQLLNNDGAVAIMSDSSDVEDVNRICMVDAQDQSVSRKNKWSAPDAEREANAAFICKSVNNHEKLVEALSETLQELKYALQNHVDILKNAGMLSGTVEDNSTVKKASKLLQSLTPLPH